MLFEHPFWVVMLVLLFCTNLESQHSITCCVCMSLERKKVSLVAVMVFSSPEYLCGCISALFVRMQLACIRIYVVLQMRDFKLVIGWNLFSYWVFVSRLLVSVEECKWSQNNENETNLKKKPAQFFAQAIQLPFELCAGTVVSLKVHFFFSFHKQ